MSMELHYEQEEHVRKFLYKSLLNSAWLCSRARLTLKKLKYFLLPDHHLAENLILVFGF